jgi:ankyrin repeat protein
MANRGNIFSVILKAAKDNDVATMEAVLQMAPSAAKAGNAIQQTGLHVAAIWGNLEVAITLIDAGADINAQNQFGVTPLASAVPGNHLAMVKLLLDERADPRIRAQNGMMAFEAAKTNEMRILLGAPELKGHEAILNSDAAKLEALLVAGSLNVSDQDADGDTILHLAAKAASGEVLKPLVDEEFDEVKARVHGSTILDLLLAHDSAKGFAEAQALHNDAGFMPLHIVASDGNLAACEGLLRATHPDGLVDMISLERGEYQSGQWGKKNSQGKLERLASAGSAPLHMVVQLMHDAKEEAEDDGDEDFAIDASLVSLVRLLLERGASANVADAEMQTPLHIALMGGLHEIVGLLCDAGADLTLGCKSFGKSNTALHQATLLRDVTSIKLLTAHGAAVDVPGRDGWTPLGMAVRSNAVDVVKALLEAKASPHAASGTGKTPLEIANINGKAGLVELLQAVEIA